MAVKDSNWDENDRGGADSGGHNEDGMASPAPGSAGGQSREIEAARAALSPEDFQHYLEFERKLQLVRDWTTSVVDRCDTGLFLVGRGGVSKSYTVIRQLERLRANFRVSNSRLTGRGLFDLLADFSDCIHVLEDVESMMNDNMAIGVLRSALWPQQTCADKGAKNARVITWTANNLRRETVFTGGVIVICNRQLRDLPEVQALQTRVPCMSLEPGCDELRATMRLIASHGHNRGGRTADRAECGVVCEFIIAESMQLQRPLDLRMLVSAFGDYLQWRDGAAGVHWQDQVRARIRERPTGFTADVDFGSREDRRRQEFNIVREIMQATTDPQERVRLWGERTGKSQATLYRRMEDIR